MSDPISFDSTSPRFGLPLLFAGQAQKEVFVNEALSLIDGLVHCAIEGSLDTPPATPADGMAWLVGAAPSGDWTDHAGHIAFRQNGQWLFTAPSDGMRIPDKSTGQDLRMTGGVWNTPVTPGLPSGGTVVDVEARQAFSDLIAALRDAGIFPQQ